jgi:hypothetical protein
MSDLPAWVKDGESQHFRRPTCPKSIKDELKLSVKVYVLMKL